MEILRTPDDRFRNLPGYDFEPHYTEVPGPEGRTLRIHHLDEGPPTGEVVLCLHGEPTWSYLYRKMIPVFRDAGLRTLAPDFVGFGRSDKPARREDYTYQRHVDWMSAWLEQNDVKGATLVCQDWGGLIGLRLVAEIPDRFARVVVANTGLPTGDQFPKDAVEAVRKLYDEIPVLSFNDLAGAMGGGADLPGPPFLVWRKFSANTPDLPVSGLVARTVEAAAGRPLPDGVVAAYGAPFPDARYKAGAVEFPSLVPVFPDDPAAPANQRAWKRLCAWDKPFLTAFSDSDPITAGGDLRFQENVPGARAQPHTIIKGGSHFLQEDKGEEFAEVVVDFVRRNPIA